MGEVVIEEKYLHVNGVCLHVMEAGNPEGEVLIFLHGFPEFWYGWKKQIDFFARNNYRVVAPDQRGYNLSSKPAGIKDYKISDLTNDMAALIRQYGNKKVHLVGHDWGGAVAWSVATSYPELVERLIILNLPHPQVMKDTLKRLPKQMLKSWYMGFFQLPLLPEKLVGAFNFSLLSRSMRRSAKKGTFSGEDFARYKEAWKKPGAMKAMINWYRAAKFSKMDMDQQVKVPVLLIWGMKDAFLSHEMARPSVEKCRDGKLEMVEDATHWVQHEKPDQVNQLIRDFIS